MLARLRNELAALADPQTAEHAQRFFKTGKGEYGEGDQFIGIRVPALRRLARQYRELRLDQIETLLQSKIHEQRQIALFIMVDQFRRGGRSVRSKLYDLYLRNTGHINNWDLVDASAEHIVGAWLIDRRRAPLLRLASSELIWERRIAIMATFHYIKNGHFTETLRIARTLLKDREDLIHKAAGWMLREVAKRDRKVAEGFLRTHYHVMPRTMLRYAIEKFPEDLRQAYLKGRV